MQVENNDGKNRKENKSKQFHSSASRQQKGKKTGTTTEGTVSPSTTSPSTGNNSKMMIQTTVPSRHGHNGKSNISAVPGGSLTGTKIGRDGNDTIDKKKKDAQSPSSRSKSPSRAKKIQSRKKLMEDLMFLRDKLEKAKEEVQVRKGRLRDHLESGENDKKKKKKKKSKTKTSSSSKSVCSTWTEDSARLGGGNASVMSEIHPRKKKVRAVRKVTNTNTVAASTATATAPAMVEDETTNNKGTEPPGSKWTNPFSMISGLIHENGITTKAQEVETIGAGKEAGTKKPKTKETSKASLDLLDEKTTPASTAKKTIVVKRRKKKSASSKDFDDHQTDKHSSSRSLDARLISSSTRGDSSRSLDARLMSPGAQSLPSSVTKKGTTPAKRKSKKKVTSKIENTTPSSTNDKTAEKDNHDSINIAEVLEISPLTPAEGTIKKTKKGGRKEKSKGTDCALPASEMNESGDLSESSAHKKRKKQQEISKEIVKNPDSLDIVDEGSQSTVNMQSANSSFSSIPSPVTPADVLRKKKKHFNFLPSPQLLLGVKEINPADKNQSSPSSKASVSLSSVKTPPPNESLPFDAVTTPKEDKTPQSIKAKKELFEKLFQKKSDEPLPSIATPAGRRRRGLPEVLSPPKKLKGGFVELNLATPMRAKKKPAPKRILDSSKHGQNRAEGYIESACNILDDESHEKEVRQLVHRIDKAGGFPVTKRLSLRDNQLVGEMIMVIRNDPSITSIEVAPEAFGTISSTLLNQFIDSLRLNLHLKKMTFSGVELGNDFLYSLATSMESNFVLEEIDLSRNLFTNAGLAEFCQAVAGSNETCRKLLLENQTTPISVASEDDVLDAFRENKSLTTVKLDFQSEDAADELRKIIRENRMNDAPEVNTDEKLLNVLRYEAERAQELWEERQDDQSTVEISGEDWKNLYELSILFDKRKLNKVVQQAAEDSFIPATQRRNADGMTKSEKKDFLFGAFKKNMEESVACFNTDGSFLTPEFINKYLVEDKDEDSLTFDYHGQWKLFKRFPVHDPDRAFIVKKFVDALVSHPRGHQITGINMANTGCGDDFLIAMADRCLDDDSCLPNLYMINFETNFINEPGIVALSTMIASPICMKYLQVVRLENQKGLLKSKAEFLLAKSMRMNYSVVVMSLRIRNLMERQQINKYVVRNVEYLRQARQRHYKATGQQRERNQVEKMFDKVAENNPDVKEVNMTGNKRFVTLTHDEKIKAAQSFSGNKYVRTLNLNSCGIDDDFVTTLANSLTSNNTLKKISLEGNNISGVGITSLFKALSKNSSVEELRLHKQSKVIPHAEEHNLADVLGPSTRLTKLGIDLRTQAAQVQVDRVLKLNRNRLLKERAESMGSDFEPNDVHTVMKF